MWSVIFHNKKLYDYLIYMTSFCYGVPGNQTKQQIEIQQNGCKNSVQNLIQSPDLLRYLHQNINMFDIKMGLWKYTGGGEWEL